MKCRLEKNRSELNIAKLLCKTLQLAVALHAVWVLNMGNPGTSDGVVLTFSALEALFPRGSIILDAVFE